MVETRRNQKIYLASKIAVIENVMICLVWSLGNCAMGHWHDAKGKTPPVSGILQESEDEMFRHVADPSAANVGPFEAADSDFYRWMEYINAKNQMLRKRIRDMEGQVLRAGLSKLDSHSKDKGRKVPEYGGSKSENYASGGPLLTALKDNHPDVKFHLEILKNWSAYLEDVKMSFDEDIPIEAVHGLITEVETKGGAADPAKMSHVSRLLMERSRSGAGSGRRGESSEKKVDSPGRSCDCDEANPADGGSGKAQEILRQIHRNLSETFLYRNITLTEIGQMSKIVDFVERYRGNVSSLNIREPDDSGKMSESMRREIIPVQAEAEGRNVAEKE